MDCLYACACGLLQIVKKPLFIFLGLRSYILQFACYFRHQNSFETNVVTIFNSVINFNISVMHFASKINFAMTSLMFQILIIRKRFEPHLKFFYKLDWIRLDQIQTQDKIFGLDLIGIRKNIQNEFGLDFSSLKNHGLDLNFNKFQRIQFTP